MRIKSGLLPESKWQYGRKNSIETRRCLFGVTRAARLNLYSMKADCKIFAAEKFALGLIQFRSSAIELTFLNLFLFECMGERGNKLLE